MIKKCKDCGAEFEGDDFMDYCYPCYLAKHDDRPKCRDCNKPIPKRYRANGYHYCDACARKRGLCLF